ncbi:Hypothetical predicted protein, partial [Xyrichtys novacula]
FHVQLTQVHPCVTSVQSTERLAGLWLSLGKTNQRILQGTCDPPADRPQEEPAHLSSGE